MNLVNAFPLLVSVISSLSLSSMPSLATAEPEEAHRFIILLNKNTASSAELLSEQEVAEQIVRRVGAEPITTLPSISAIAAWLTHNQYRQLLNSPHVFAIERDQIREMTSGGTSTYGVDMVQAHYVDDIFSANQTICILDSGYDYSHEGLPNSANITGEVAHTKLASETSLSWTQDNLGHGTLVAGILVGTGVDRGIEGILPSGMVHIHNVKITPDSHHFPLWSSDVIAGLAACESAGATIVNMSIGGEQSSQAEAMAVQQAYDNGLLLVAASGNRGSNEYFYPASYDSVISVGAIDENKHAWMFTQDNDQIELVAPGVSVKSSFTNDQYRFWDGTSAAAPYVTGIASLLWSYFPECSNDQIREVLTKSAEDLGDKGYDNLYGFGLVNARSALDYLQLHGCTLNEN